MSDTIEGAVAPTPAPISIEIDAETVVEDIEKFGEDVIEEVETALSHG